MKFIKNNWFILGLLIAVAVGVLLPKIGMFIGAGGATSTFLVVLIFFVSGFTLPREVIKNGLKDIRLHIFIQVFVFAVAPLYFFLSSLLIMDFISPEMMIGIYALACLPTTISSCIIFTQASGGNVVGTMFNAALSNSLGIVISPLLLSLFLNTAGQPLDWNDVSRIFIELGYKMLVPIILGQFARVFFQSFADRYKKKMSLVSNSAILFIVLITISKTAQNSSFHTGIGSSLIPVFYLALSYPVLMFLAYWGARTLKFSHENIVSSVYASPQKTLALGVPLLSTFFAADPALQAAAILPLLFYHPWQLFVSGLVKDLSFMKKDAAR